jgi:hypothetical protein
VTGAGGSLEAEPLKLLLKLRLHRRGEVDVAGHDLAATIKFDSTPADQDRRRKPTCDKSFA